MLNLQNKTLEELQKIASKKKIVGRSKMNKNDLIKALSTKKTKSTKKINKSTKKISKKRKMIGGGLNHYEIEHLISRDCFTDPIWYFGIIGGSARRYGRVITFRSVNNDNRLVFYVLQQSNPMYEVKSININHLFLRHKDGKDIIFGSNFIIEGAVGAPSNALIVPDVDGNDTVFMNTAMRRAGIVIPEKNTIYYPFPDYNPTEVYNYNPPPPAHVQLPQAGEAVLEGEVPLHQILLNPPIFQFLQANPQFVQTLLQHPQLLLALQQNPQVLLALPGNPQVLLALQQNPNMIPIHAAAVYPHQAVAVLHAALHGHPHAPQPHHGHAALLGLAQPPQPPQHAHAALLGLVHPPHHGQQVSDLVPVNTVTKFVNNSYECAICLDEIKERRANRGNARNVGANNFENVYINPVNLVKIRNCGHIFHRTCLQTMPEPRRCPKCREPFHL